MADDVAAWRVDPHCRVLGARGVGNENQLIAGLEPVNDLSPSGEDSPEHGRAELVSVRWNRGHGTRYDPGRRPSKLIRPGGGGGVTVTEPVRPPGQAVTRA